MLTWCFFDKSFLGRNVKALKIFLSNYKDSQKFADNLNIKGIIKRREHDINTVHKYLLDKNITPLRWYDVSGKVLGDRDVPSSENLGGIASSLNVDLVFLAEEFSLVNDSSVKDSFAPKVLAIDIESDDLEIGKGKITMISLVSEGFEKVITWKSPASAKKLKFVESFSSEKSMLEEFVNIINKLSPDVITGFFSDSFDLPYIRSRSEKLGVSLSLSLDTSVNGLKFSGGKNRHVRIEGIPHVDIHRFIAVNYSQYLQSETLTLNEISSELLGEKKHDFVIRPSSKLTPDDWLEFFKYNLKDSVLTLKLFNKFLPDLLEFSRIMKKPLFEVSRDGMSTHVEDFIVSNLHRFNEIIEKRPIHEEISSRRGRDSYVGAFVLQPTPGLYEDLAVFDFTSYWPSIISSFNLSRSTILPKRSKDSLTVSIDKNKDYYFSKTKGFFPQLLEEIILLRKKFKTHLKNSPDDPIIKARSNAYKLLANAAYGYQGFFGARYYCPEASASTTAISRDFIKEVISKAEKFGLTPIYGDTDSIMFSLNKKPHKEALDFLTIINKSLPGIMELDLEDFYSRGLWVTTRGGELGAKKKYALMNNSGKLKIRGFETVRRDWCLLARELQNDILRMILSDGNHVRALAHTKEVIKKLKDGKVSLKEIIIKTQLKKSIKEYKSLGPHVVAAKLMVDAGLPVDPGALMEYFITQPELNSKGKPAKGSKRIGDRVALPNDSRPYDKDYYLNNQVLPAVENIFQVFNIKIDELIAGVSQKKLF
ncbi:hypothetical protein COU61_01475 [Candidatus Pacearchaeota archaeon CG10_big_fil_rev_8_21_14_0_10_35_13]|nr:MAG: hypothetical protein COU61_01475 [Candidatus Pacearchaeota archaeon CG10_big_fil_rev_8_21_14_0_10_35_13]